MDHTFTFCLGSDRPAWLKDGALFEQGTRFFYSFNTLVNVKEPAPSAYDFDMDSGGFTRLSQDGSWDRWPAKDFVSQVRRISAGYQRLQRVAIQDWMCEPFILKKTGLSVEEHQRRTVDSYLRLRELAPDVEWMPVLQGWHHGDYLRCWEMYERVGVNLASHSAVGVGSTCRRHNTATTEALADDLRQRGLSNLWMLGMKTDGLRRCVRHVRWADSFAWSLVARVRHYHLPECRHGRAAFRRKLGKVAHGSCAHCPRFARRWYEEQQQIIRRALSQPVQQQLIREVA